MTIDNVELLATKSVHLFLFAVKTTALEILQFNRISLNEVFLSKLQIINLLMIA